MEFIYQDFISVRVTCPFHPGLLLPVQCFSLGGEIVGSVTEICHTRVRAGLRRARTHPARLHSGFGGPWQALLPATSSEISPQAPAATHPSCHVALPCLEDFWLQRKGLCILPHPAPPSPGDAYFGA